MILRPTQGQSPFPPLRRPTDPGSPSVAGPGAQRFGEPRRRTARDPAARLPAGCSAPVWGHGGAISATGEVSATFMPQKEPRPPLSRVGGSHPSA